MALGFSLRGLLGSLLLALVPAGEAATLASPQCDALAAWAQGLDAKDRWQLNSANEELWLPVHFSGPETEALFGKPVLAWSRDEAVALSKHARRCARQARRAKQKAESKALRALRHVAYYRVAPRLKRMEANRAKLEEELDALLGVAPSRPALLALASLREMGPGGAMAWEDRRKLRSAQDPASNHAGRVVAALRGLPDSATEDVRAPIEERFHEVRGLIVAELEQSLGAVPGSLEGLKGLETMLAGSREELAGALMEQDFISLETAAAARRDAIEAVLLDEARARLAAVPEDLEGLGAIEDIVSGPSAVVLSEPRLGELREAAAARRVAVEAAVLAEEMAKLAAVPETLQGLGAVDDIVSGPSAAALSEPRLGELREAAAARRQAISDALVAAEMAKLDDMPATLDGLQSLVSRERTVLRRLEGEVAAGSLAGFKGALAERYAELGREAFEEYSAALAALPETERGLKDLRALAGTVRAPVERMPEPVREEYAEVTAERRSVIAAAVEREEARLASLPLPGAVFVDSAGPRFEFRDDTRVYLTLTEEVTVEAEYEVDGDRIVFRTPQGNMVLSREGAWLKGHGLELKRQAEP